MLRPLALISCLLTSAPVIAAPVTADPQTQLDVPGVTASFERSGAYVEASYAWQNGLMDLTVLVTDAEGDALRTRVGLRDGQRHTLLVPASEDWVPSTRIDFRRIGSHIEVHVDDAAFQTFLAAR